MVFREHGFTSHFAVALSPLKAERSGLCGKERVVKKKESLSQSRNGLKQIEFHLHNLTVGVAASEVFVVGMTA